MELCGAQWVPTTLFLYLPEGKSSRQPCRRLPRVHASPLAPLWLGLASYFTPSTPVMAGTPSSQAMATPALGHPSPWMLFLPPWCLQDLV